MKKIIFQILFFIGLLVVVAFLAGIFAKKSSWREYPVLVEPAVVDFGEISMAKGVVEANFIIRNNAAEDIAINSMLTSCGCTTAKLIFEGKESPVFGMHGNPTDWSQTIGAGKTADLKAFFDPNAHGPEAVGPFTRSVKINLGAPFNQSLEVKLKGTVVK